MMSQRHRGLRPDSPLLSAAKRGFLFYAFSTLALALLFASYIVGSSVLEIMNAEGWIFFLLSCVSHSSQLCLLPYLFYLLFLIFGRRGRKAAGVLMVVLVCLLLIVAYINGQVYAIYRFHLNGLVLGMLFGEGAGEIFNFSFWLYLKELSLLLLLIVAVSGLWFLSRRIYARWHKAYAWPVTICLVCCTLWVHVYHVYASFYRHQAVVKSAFLLPYYFPTTSYGLLVKMGCKAPDGGVRMADNMGGGGDLQYPVRPLTFDTIRAGRKKPNILLIVIDSWNARTFTPECTPNIWRFAQDAELYTNHISSSNGTRGGLFGLFYGLPECYWQDFEASGVTPLLIDHMQREGYGIQCYPSAFFNDPPFARLMFNKIKGVNTRTEGETAYARDSTITEEFIASLSSTERRKRPFFSFLFYDLPHSFELTKEQNRPFHPAWAYADYTRLSNDMDPTPFFNLYRNCVHHDDRMIGRVLQALAKEKLTDSTLVIITGDHAQEFNENHRNYWGHNGNFSKAQTHVMLVCRFPGRPPRRYTHRTTHYDIPATIMKESFGVKNPLSDFSLGYLLTDSVPRRWHMMGNATHYAFSVEGDTLLEKTGGGALDVYTPNMTPVQGYKLDVKDFSEAMKRINHFYR